jgi:hypothetical protein
VTGQVTQIDPVTGTFTLRTAEAGTLNLYAAPATIANVRPGDTVTVTIGPAPVR